MAHKRPTPEELPLPADMGATEQGLRRAVYAGWLDSPGAFALARLILADWCDENGHPDGPVCRSEWTPVRCRSDSPGGWWCWAVRPPAMHWDLVTARLRGRKHNERFWLCFPDGWVRFTGGYRLRDGYTPMHLPPGGDYVVGENAKVVTPDAWCVCIQSHQTRYGTPVENTHGRLGWTALFHPPGACHEPGRPVAPPVPGFFDELEG